MEQINLQPEVAGLPEIDMNPATSGDAPPSSPATAADRASKAKFGLGPSQGVTYDDLYKSMVTGNEDALRGSVAANQDVQKLQNKYDAIRAYAQQKGGPLTPDDMTSLEMHLNPPPTDPRNIYEQSYAKEFTNYLKITDQDRTTDENGSDGAEGWHWSDTILRDANRDDPAILRASQEGATELVTKKQMIAKYAQDVQDASEREGWGSFIANTALSVIPGRNEYKLRTADGGFSTSSVLLESDLFNQTRQWLRLPIPQLQDKLDTVLKPLMASDPSLAARVIASLQGQSQSEILAGNIGAGLDISGATAVGHLVKGLIPDVLKPRKDIAKLVKKGFEDIAQGSNSSMPPPVAQATAAGDLAEGAVKYQTSMKLDNFGNSVELMQKQALDALPKALRADREAIINDPHIRSTEISNRIDENTRNLEAVLQETSANMARVHALPEFAANEAALRKSWQEIKDSLPGSLSNQVIDITAPYSINVGGTSVFKQDIALGRTTGELFFRKENAEAFKKLAQLPNEATVEQSGLGFYIKMTKNFNLTSDMTRDGLLSTKSSVAPQSWLKSFVGNLMTPENVLSVDNNMMRKIATYGASVLKEIAVDQTRLIKKSLSGFKTSAGEKILVGFKTGDSEYFVRNNGQVLRNKLPTDPNIMNQWRAEKNTLERELNKNRRIVASQKKYDEAAKKVARDSLDDLALKHKTVVENIANASGDRPVASKTVFISDAERDKLNIKGNSKLVDNGDGTYSIVASRPGGWKELNQITAKTTPEVGDVPLDLYKPGTHNSKNAYGARYAGAPITEVSHSAQPSRFGQNSRWNTFERVIDAARSMVDPETGERGYFFKNTSELDNYYLRHIKRLPDAGEQQAYFAYKNLIEYDRILRNAAVYRNKARVGAEQLSISHMNTETKQLEKSPFFDAVERKTFPGGTDTAMIVGPDSTSQDVVRLGSIQPKKLQALKEGVASGQLRVFEVYDPETTPLAKFGTTGNARVRYVIAQNIETKALDFEQVARRGGGHFDYDYEHYIKQARIRPERIGKGVVHWYEGDTTVMPVAIRSMGHNIAGKLDEVRQLIQKKDWEGARALVEKDLPMSFKEVKSWFTKQYKDGEWQPARLSVNEPIQVVPKGKMIADMSKDDLERRFDVITKDGRTINTFRDGTKHGSLARTNQIEYTGQRDAWEVYTVQDRGRVHNPLYNYEPAKMVDPLQTMERSLSRIINSTFLDDYKTFSVERWTKEASQYLKPSDAEIKSAPYYHFNNPEYTAGTPAEIKRRLEIQRAQIQQLMGTPSVVDGLLHSAAQKLYDSIYEKFGGRVANNAWLDPTWVIPKIKDPTAWLRSVAFHAKIGLWSIPQLWVQAQTFAVVNALSPKSSAAAGVGALLSGWAKHGGSASQLAKMDEVASRVSIAGMRNFKPGQFTESHNLMRSTGFDRVGKEHAFIDNNLSANLFETTKGKVLEGGTFFFRKGEQFASRHAAWHTAYLEFREANPLGRVTDLDRLKILQRADDLSGNMSSASRSMLHTGILSLPTQFLTYQLRLAELFFSKRLTTADRARLLGSQAMLYGVPTSIGITGLPMADWIRGKAIENDYVVGDNYINDLVMNGFPSMIGGLVTGNNYNVGDRFGTQGFETIKEIMNGDKAWWEIATGASGSVIGGGINSISGITAAFKSYSEGGSDQFPLKSSDFFDMFKEIASVNNTQRLIGALNTQKWMSKNEGFLDTVNGKEAIFQYLSGLQRQEVSDANIKTDLIKGREEATKTALKMFTREFRRSLDAYDANNPEAGKDYMQRAFTYLHFYGYPETEYTKAISIAAQGRESILERVDQKYYMQKVPEGQGAAKAQTYTKTLQTNDKRLGN